MLRNINYVTRFVTQLYDNDDIKGYSFEILYLDKLVLTDGHTYPTFDDCVKAFSDYIITLYGQPPFKPMVVAF